MLIHLEKLGKSFGEKIVLHDVTASVEREDRIGIVGQNGAGKTTLLKILTGEYQDYDGEFSVTHGVTLGYLEQNAKLDVTLDIYGEMRSSFAPVLDAMAQMQVLERKMAAQPDDTELLARHDQLQNIVDAADGYNMDVNIKKVLSGMGFPQDTWQKNIAVLSGGELTRLRLAKLLLEKPLNKITINDITEDCGVNRMTFYYHFKDIYDLVEWSFIEDAARALEGKKSYDTWQEGFLNIFHAVLENKPFITNVYRSVSREQVELYLYKLVHDLIYNVVEEKAQGLHVPEEDKAFIADFYKYAFVGIMLDWIKNGMTEPPERIIERISILIQGDIARAVGKFCTPPIK